MKYENSSWAGEPKMSWISKEPTITRLQKIAANSENLNEMPCMKKGSDMNKLKDREFVAAVNDPAKFNGLTFEREYGGIPN